MFEGNLSRRVLSHFWLKTLGSTVAISVFFVGYFFALHHPFRATTTMPLLALDRWIPVLAWSGWVYFSLWVYICMPSSLMRTSRALGHYLLGAFLLSVAGLSLFLFFPSEVPDPGVDWSVYPTLAFLKQSDASGNACPSLHVAFAVFSGLWLCTLLRRLKAGQWWYWFNFGWCTVIILSTLTTKQHVVIDVICGMLLGLSVYGINRWWSLRRGVAL